MKYDNSKLGPKTMKPALESFFKLENQKQSSDWYGWDDRTPIQYIVSF